MFIYTVTVLYVNFMISQVEDRIFKTAHHDQEVEPITYVCDIFLTLSICHYT